MVGKLEKADGGTLLEWLAAYSHGVELDAVPEAVAEQSALCLLDTVGCNIASGA